MAFANVAGRAGFILDLDKSALDRGLVEAERQFDRATSSIASSSSRLGVGGRDALLGQAERSRQLQLSQSARETEALAAAFDDLEARGVASQANIADAAAKVRNELDATRRVAVETADDTVASTGALGTGLAGATLRATAFGFAISAAYQASQRAQDALKQTGAAAFTTEGRLRNLGAALISGDLIGGVEALTRQPKTLDELGISAQQAAGRLEALRQVATGQVAALQEQAAQVDNNKDLLAEYNRIVEEAGTGNQQLAQQLLDQGRAWNELSTQMKGALNQALAFRDAQGNVILPGGFAGLRPQPEQPPPPGASILGPGAVPDTEPSRSVPSRIFERQQEARRAGDIQAERKAAQDAVDFAKRRLEIVKREGPLREQRRREYQAALNDLDAVDGRIADEEKRAADKRAADAAERRRKAQAAADDARRKREREETERASALRAGFATTQTRLENAYQQALTTPGQRDDRLSASALSTFLGRRSRDTRLDEGEREDYRQRQLGFLRGRAKDAKDATLAELQMQEDVLKNDVAAAELTEKNTAKRAAALRKLLKFYDLESHDRDLTRAEREGFRGDRIATQKQLNALLNKDDATQQDLGAFFRDMLEAQQRLFTGFFSNFLGGTGAGNALQTHALEQFTLAGNGQRDETNRLLRRIAGARQQRLADEGLMA